MHITPDDLSGPEIRALLETHFAGMLANSPKDKCHFLDFDGLKGPDVTFWSVWTGDAPDAQLMGCGALREMMGANGSKEGEIKSMRTDEGHLRKGAGAEMLRHIIAEAQRRGYVRLNLETGSGAAFDAAHALYLAHGFTYCGPFGDYREDPFSRFMTKPL
ncbi:GNAT family N-acetyltransferase [Sphingorhabdus arenilitoris]|uniref:GNAT family N-acetyltransferase n=1 Tax=Sphingorhabdus arenilitoris TaxID=1490041 RepID=A0ABV8RD73_9SPHN